ncbi:MBL fold metallo-hydrolase [Cuniculiplasma sp. SKW3]|uniref:MBL fold metallo-hydrolase n=1 Tax=Cuniculiplasma sp. SKW3 TaxID=3400170 RepID=UPI003FD407F8
MNVEVYYVPIRIRALKFASVYLLRTDDHSFLVDSGMDSSALSFLEEKGVNFKELDAVLLTHMHIDHIGGSKSIQDKYGIPVYINKLDRNKVLSIQNDISGFMNESKSFLKEMGVPDEMTKSMGDNHPLAIELKNYEKVDLQIFENIPQEINEIEFYYVPGHSPGSTCFIPKDSDIIFTGDHILERITPNISYYDRDEDMLGEYLLSLAKTEQLKLKTAFPGHGSPFTRINDRIEQIKNHHRVRIDEIKRIIDTNKMSAYDVAKRMKWSRGRTMDSMNIMEQNFAVGEAIAHLRYMENQSIVESEIINGIRLYSNI